MILKVSASGYLLHFPFGAIGPLGLQESGCTLEFHLHPYCLALDLLVGDGPGAENIAQLQCVMWLFTFPVQGDHAVLLPILTGWLTRLLEFCDGFCGWFFSRWPPPILIFSWGGDLLRISSGLEVILGYFCFAEFGVLELSLLFLFRQV